MLPRVSKSLTVQEECRRVLSPVYYDRKLPSVAHEFPLWYILRTEDISPKQGFVFAWFGRRTRSLGKGGSRTVDTLFGPLGGIFTVVNQAAAQSKSHDLGRRLYAR